MLPNQRLTSALPEAGFAVRLGKLGVAPPASRPAMRVPDFGSGVGLSFVLWITGR